LLYIPAGAVLQDIEMRSLILTYMLPVRRDRH
jgi:hypothetical protein